MTTLKFLAPVFLFAIGVIGTVVIHPRPKRLTRDLTQKHNDDNGGLCALR